MEENEKPEFHIARGEDGLSTEEAARMPGGEETGLHKNNNVTDEKKKYRIKPGFILREIAGEYAIVPVDAECLFSNAVMAPNDSAVFLWKIFQEPCTIERAVEKTLQEYDVAEDIVQNAIYRFVNDTLKFRILEEAD